MEQSLQPAFGVQVGRFRVIHVDPGVLFSSFADMAAIAT